MEIKDVFISYKSEEFDDALWVKNQLEERGFPCWMAPMSISGGASYASEIPAAIQNCKVFVLILSATVQTSKWVSRELDQAINANKLILPFMVENCNLTDEFGFDLSNVQRYYAYQDKEGSLEKMVGDIRAHLGIPAPVKEPAPVAAPAAPAPAVTPVPVAQPKPTPQPKPAAKPAAEKKKGKKVLLGLLIAVVLVPILLVALVVGVLATRTKANRLEIAGVTYKKSDYSVTVEGATITDADMAALAEMEDLGHVAFRNCTITANDLGALSDHDLYSLELSDCGLTDAQLNTIDFSAMEHLIELNLNGNDQLTNPGVLHPLADSLTKLCLDTVDMTEAAWLVDFTQLEYLSLNKTGITSLDCLINMAYLEHLEASNNALSHVDGLINTTQLKTVKLLFNQLTDVSVLANSAATLKTLDVDGNALTDLSALAGCTALQYLSANGNQLTSVAWTGQMHALSTLYLSGNRIATIEGITQSEKLTELNLSHNALTAVEGLTFTSEWSVTADFSHNQIAAVSLPANCRYALLYLHDNPLQSDAFLVGLQGSEVSMDYFDTLQAATLQKTQFYNIYIVDCPVNRKVELEDANYAVKLVTIEELEGL